MEEKKHHAEEERQYLERHVQRIPELKKIREHNSKYNVCVSAGTWHTVGLKTNGTVIAVGGNEHGQCDTNGWHNIVAVAAGDFHTVGLKTNGTVIATGRNNYGQCNTSSWRDIGPPSREQLLKYQWKLQGLCGYCGGKIGGIFTKKCKSCGKPK